MSGRKSVNKGKAREREALALVRREFPAAVRSGHGQGEGGAHRRPDIEGVPFHWVSVKGGKAPRVLDALEEADDNGEALMPVVLFRRDGDGRWWGAMPAPALMQLLTKVEGFKP